MAISNLSGPGCLGKALLAVLILQAAPAFSGTIFTVQGTLVREVELTGTIEIDTLSGGLVDVDLFVDPIFFGQFPTTTMHYTSDNTGLGHPYGRTFIGGTIFGGWANAGLQLTLDVPSLMGYTGGQFKPTESVLNFWSGLIVRSTTETSQLRYYPLSSGTLTPLVVPEPGSAVLLAVALLAYGVWLVFG